MPRCMNRDRGVVLAHGPLQQGEQGETVTSALQGQVFVLWPSPSANDGREDWEKMVTEIQTGTKIMCS